MAARQSDVPVLIQGDHMVRSRADFPEHGIFAGDWLAVLKQDTADPGQLVVCLVEGKATVRPFEPGLTVLGRISGLYRSLA